MYVWRQAAGEVDDVETVVVVEAENDDDSGEMVIDVLIRNVVVEAATIPRPLVNVVMPAA